VGIGPYGSVFQQSSFVIFIHRIIRTESKTISRELGKKWQNGNELLIFVVVNFLGMLYNAKGYATNFLFGGFHIYV